MIIHGDELLEARRVVPVGLPSRFLHRISRFLAERACDHFGEAYSTLFGATRNQEPLCAMVKASTPTPPERLGPAEPLPVKSTPSAVRRESLEQPSIDVEGAVEHAPRLEALPPLQVALSPGEVELGRVSPPPLEFGFATTPPRPHIVHLPTLTQIPTISIPLHRRLSLTDLNAQMFLKPNPYTHLCKYRHHLRKSARPRPYLGHISSTSRLHPPKRFLPYQSPLHRRVLSHRSGSSHAPTDIHTIPVSPLPTRMAHQSGSSHASTDILTIPIPVAPPPTRLSHQSQTSRASTDITSLSSAASVDEPPTVPERRGRHFRFSRIVHLFGDKRADLWVDACHLLPALADDPSLALPPVPFSSAPRSRSMNEKKKRPCSLVLRSTSCPILHHHPHGHTRSLRRDGPVPQSPSPSCKKLKAEKKQEAAPRPRTHPYEAPYFIPRPDSEGFEEPFPRRRRRPSRGRITPSISVSNSSVAVWSGSE
ncbi:hypothetical protein DFH06DRAFT_272187 [Mycena polygramma]|nr:hypothetical protein DFH06DRAFT_272187 [Mycena polygramma]